MPALCAQGLDAGTGGLRDPQAVKGQQGDQRMLGRISEPGSNQDRTELVAVQPGGMRLIIQPRAADMRGRRMIQQVFLYGVAVKPGDRAQPAGDGGPGAAAGFHIARETFDVGPADLEQPLVVLLAPGGEKAQVQGVSLAGQAGVTGQRQPLLGAEYRLGDGDRGGRRGGSSGWSSGTSRVG
jgi:hypothetical protein